MEPGGRARALDVLRARQFRAAAGRGWLSPRPAKERSMPQSRAVRPLLLLAALVTGAIHAPRARADTASDPVPVLPGATILSPGPRAPGFNDGLAADPITIGNSRGLVPLASML